MEDGLDTWTYFIVTVERVLWRCEVVMCMLCINVGLSLDGV